MVDAIQAAIFVVIALVVAAAPVMVWARRRVVHIIDLVGTANECVAKCRTCGRLKLTTLSSCGGLLTWKGYLGREDDAYQAAYAHIHRRYGQIFNHLDYDEIN